MKKIKRPFSILGATLLLVAFTFLGCAKPTKDVILIGGSRSITGPLDIFEDTAFGPVYKMWINEVNAAGGIFVKEYNKRLPLELIVYDDGSNPEKMANNIKKLINEDKVDLLIPPTGTDMLFAAAPIVTELQYVLIGAEGGASRLSKMISRYPYLFSVLNHSDHNQVDSLMEILVDNDIKRAGFVYIDDLHGIEYSSVTTPALRLNNIELVLAASVPEGIEDLSSVILEAKEKDVEAFFVFGYPGENFLAVGQSMALGFNPKLYLAGPGGNFSLFPELFGPATNGILTWGAWSTKSSPAHAEFRNKMVKEYGEGIIDWWGHNVYYASLQVLQAAIESVGSLDQTMLRDALRTQRFDTILGETWFDTNHELAEPCYAGQVGQWQNGVYEVVGPSSKATAPMIFPKPEWPSQE